MTDHATFLRAIIARPDLDLPRLVYADALEETARMVPCPICHRVPDCYACHGTGEVSNGHAERAEFIRVQCELARREAAGQRGAEDTRGQQTCSCEFCTLRRRERELWPGVEVVNRHKWEAIGWPAGIPLVPFQSVPRRGFIESITCGWSDFRTHAAAIRKATPLRRARLIGDDWIHGIGVWLGFDFKSGDGFYTHPDYPGIEFELPQRVTPLLDAISFEDFAADNGIEMPNPLLITRMPP